MSHEERRRALEAEADQMQERSEELGEEIEDVQEEWEAKELDRGVPGAQPSERERAPHADEPSHGPAVGAEDVEDER
jgi:predicted  nucleic acid-binding Zn-ribbon protein